VSIRNNRLRNYSNFISMKIILRLIICDIVALIVALFAISD